MLFIDEAVKKGIARTFRRIKDSRGTNDRLTRKQDTSTRSVKKGERWDSEPKRAHTFTCRCMCYVAHVPANQRFAGHE